MMAHGGANHPAHSYLEHSGSTTAPYDMACDVWSQVIESEKASEHLRVQAASQGVAFGIAHVLAYVRQV